MNDTKSPRGHMIDIKATREQIKSIGGRLATLSNEAEHGFAQLTKITLELVHRLESAMAALDSSKNAYEGMARQVKKCRDDRDICVTNCNKLNIRATELQAEVDRLRRLECRLETIREAAMRAERIADNGTREEAIKATADVMRVIFADSGHGVMLPDVLDCPDGEPLHGHHDGCPSCGNVESLEDAIVNEISQALEHLNIGASVWRKGRATKVAHIKIHRSPDTCISDCIAWHTPGRPIQPGWRTCSQGDMLAGD